MPYFVKVIPPHRRARVHAGGCKFCRDGRGMENQDKGTGPTYWFSAFPAAGLETIAEARQYMDALGGHYTDTGECPILQEGERPCLRAPKERSAPPT
jgi:hypothetical protein